MSNVTYNPNAGVARWQGSAATPTVGSGTYQTVAGRLRLGESPATFTQPGPSQTYPVIAATVRSGGNAAGVGVGYSFASGRTRSLGAPAAVSMAQTLLPYPAVLRTLATPPSVGTTGTVSYAVVPARLRFPAPPTASVTPRTFHIRFLRGPYSLMPVGLPEGVPCEAGIVAGSIVYEMLFLGGHDGVNKLVGGGFQTTSGMPSWNAPDPNNPGQYLGGICLYDPSAKLLWLSNTDGTWTSK